MNHLERRLQHLESKLRKECCEHPQEARVKHLLPVWLFAPDPPKPFAERCRVCGEWFPVQSPFEQGLSQASD